MSWLEQAEGSVYLALSGKISAQMLRVAGSIMPVEMMHYTALQSSLARMLSTGFCSGSTSSTSPSGTAPTPTGSGITALSGCTSGQSFNGSAALSSSPGMASSNGFSFIFQGQPSSFLAMAMSIAQAADAAMRASTAP